MLEHVILFTMFILGCFLQQLHKVMDTKTVRVIVVTNVTTLIANKVTSKPK